MTDLKIFGELNIHVDLVQKRTILFAGKMMTAELRGTKMYATIKLYTKHRFIARSRRERDS